MLSDKRLLRKLRKVMGATIALPGVFACSSQISCGVSVTEGNFVYDLDRNGKLTISALDGTSGRTLKGIPRKTLESLKKKANVSKITSLIIGEGIDKIEERAFDLYGLEEIYFAGNVKEIGDYAFSGVGAKKITLPDSLEVIGVGAFNKNPQLTNCTVPRNVVSIGDFAFASNARLEKIEFATRLISNPTLSLGRGVFAQCKKLETITIPEFVSSTSNSTIFSPFLAVAYVYSPMIKKSAFFQKTSIIYGDS